MSSHDNTADGRGHGDATGDGSGNGSGNGNGNGNVPQHQQQQQYQRQQQQQQPSLQLDTRSFASQQQQQRAHFDPYRAMPASAGVMQHAPLSAGPMSASALGGGGVPGSTGGGYYPATMRPPMSARVSSSSSFGTGHAGAGHFSATGTNQQQHSQQHSHFSAAQYRQQYTGPQSASAAEQQPQQHYDQRQQYMYQQPTSAAPLQQQQQSPYDLSSAFGQMSMQQPGAQHQHASQYQHQQAFGYHQGPSQQQPYGNGYHQPPPSQQQQYDQHYNQKGQGHGGGSGGHGGGTGGHGGFRNNRPSSYQQQQQQRDYAPQRNREYTHQLQWQREHRPQSAGGYMGGGNFGSGTGGGNFGNGTGGGNFGSGTAFGNGTGGYDPAATTASYQQAFASGQGVSIRPPSGQGQRGGPPPIATGRGVTVAAPPFVPSGGSGTLSGPASAAALEGVQFLWNQRQQQQQEQGAPRVPLSAGPQPAAGFPYSTFMPSTVGPQPSQQPFRADRPPTAVEPVHNGGATDTSGWFGNGSNKAPPLTISTTTADAEAPASTPGTTAADANATALTIQFPRRPGQGTHGRVIPVRANFFEFLTLPGQNIYHYDVRIMPEVPPSLNRKIFHQMEEQFGKSKLDSAIVVFDGRKNMYTPKELPIEEGSTLEIEVIVADDDRPPQPPPASTPTSVIGYSPRKFTVRIRRASIIHMDNLHQFLQGKLTYTPYDALQAIDVLMRQRPSMILTTVGRSFFTRNDVKMLGDGAECWMGFHQSVRPAKNRLMVNVDVSATAFFEPGPILNFISRTLGKRGPTDIKAPLKTREVDKCERLLKGVKVVVTHRGEMRRKYKILGFSRTMADETMFKFSRPSEDGSEALVEKEVSVADYFATHYNIQLRFPYLPCLKVGSIQRAVFLPLEVCDIIPGQRYLRKLNEQQTAQMIRLTCQTPDRRANKIAQAINDLGLAERNTGIIASDKDFLENFGVKVSEEMMEIPARVLDPPTIQYHPTSREPLITPREGAWNLRDKKVVQPATLHSWAVVCFGNPRDMPQQKVDHFLREMILTCRDTGLTITNPHPPAIYGDPNGNIEAMLHTAWQAAGEAVQSYPQLILCVMPNTGVPLYAEIKRVGDTVLGVPTQCVQAKHTFQPKKQYCANVCLKINAKLGGVNSFIVKNPNVVGDDGLAWLAEEPTIIFGADITHPTHGETKSTGSVCALVGSLDRLASRYAATVRLLPPRRETILPLAEMVQELLKVFYHENNQIAPTRILFYRDGCSESLFHEIATAEIAAIREACDKLQPGYRPTITFVAVQKRHHARVFASNVGGKPKDADRSGNIPAGTVIDSHITHPNEYDFYLCSHAGLQGTSRPTHYHVLHDENGFTADSLQELTYRMCYGYARCTRSVSVVPPAYYADLVAFRAKYHMRGMGSASMMSGGMMSAGPGGVGGSNWQNMSTTGSVVSGTPSISGRDGAMAFDDGNTSCAGSERGESVSAGPGAPGSDKGTLDTDQLSTTDRGSRRKRPTKEDDELTMLRLQGRLAMVKPELQRCMYYM